MLRYPTAHGQLTKRGQSLSPYDLVRYANVAMAGTEAFAGDVPDYACLVDPLLFSPQQFVNGH